MTVLYIPVHKVVREIDGKLFLALRAASRGHDVVIGRKSKMLNHLKHAPPGVFFDTRMNVSRETVPKKSHASLTKRNHKIWLFDEEATSTDNADAYKKMMISSNIVSRADKILAWSGSHADMIKSVCDQGNVVESGHPRYDIYRNKIRDIYSHDAERHRDKYGKYILIPSSFGSLALGTDDDIETKIEQNIKKGFFKDVNDSDTFKKKILYRRETALHFVDAIERLARKNPTINIVLRPHFSETSQMWRCLIGSELKNVHVVHEGPIASWLYGASLIIHHHCSTAVEAFLLGRQVISYVPVKNEAYDRFLPRAVSYVTHDFEELQISVKRILNGEALVDHDSVSVSLSYYLKVAGALASDAILDILDSEYPENEIGLKVEDASILSLPSTMNYIKLQVQDWLRSHRNLQEPVITNAMMQEKLGNFVRHACCEKGIVINQIDSEMFLVSSS